MKRLFLCTFDAGTAAAAHSPRGKRAERDGSAVV